MKKNIFILVLLGLFSQLSFSQLAMGKWRTHFAYNNVSQIAQSANKIYAVSEGALYSVDKQDGGLEFYSKNTGLNGTNISRIKFDPLSNQLLIVYSTGNIDLLSSNGVINLPDLYNKQMSSSKDVNQIQFYQNYAYLSCNFGILVVNMKKKEIADTYFIGPNASDVKVLSTIVHNGILYALSATTLYQAIASRTDLVNYESWTTNTSLPGSDVLQKITSFGGKLILMRGGKLYTQGSDNIWTPFLSNINVTDFNVSNNSFNIFDGTSAYLTDASFNIKTINNLGVLSDAEYDLSNSTYWFAANALGVISYKQIASETPSINYYKPVGPAVNIPWDMTFSGQKLFVVPGGRWASQYNREGDIMMYENGTWNNIYAKSIRDSTKHAVLDLMNVAVDPTDNKHFFVTSYGTGLYEFRNNLFYKWYTPNNSFLESIIPSDPYNYTRIDGAVFDKQNNLWMNNIGTIKILMNDSTWKKLSYSAAHKPTLGKTFISSLNQNQKWIPSVRYTPGICIFDDGGTISDPTDDKSIFISTFTYPEIDSNNQTKPVSVYPNVVYTTAQDKNGVMWVGTDMGPFLFNNLTNVFNSDYTCSRVKIPRNDSTNLADYLLVNERVKAIAIDGANRKWIGTENSGVYLMSENGQQTIQHFTTTNSPLLANDIYQLQLIQFQVKSSLVQLKELSLIKVMQVKPGQYLTIFMPIPTLLDRVIQGL